MSTFVFGMLCGAYVTALVFLVVPFFARELRAWRAVRALTAEKREDQNRKIRIVLRSSVSTPLPFKPLRTKGAR